MINLNACYSRLQAFKSKLRFDLNACSLGYIRRKNLRMIYPTLLIERTICKWKHFELYTPTTSYYVFSIWIYCPNSRSVILAIWSCKSLRNISSKVIHCALYLPIYSLEQYCVSFFHVARIAFDINITIKKFIFEWYL